MKKTKIICTIGPACTDEKILTDMALAGMNVARLNFSHGTYEEQLEKINLIKKVREKLFARNIRRTAWKNQSYKKSQGKT